MVEELKDRGLNLKEALHAVGLAKSSYFYKEKKRREKPLNPELVKALKDLRDYELVCGYRKVTYWLRKRKGIKANHKAVLRHMKRLGIIQPRKIKGPKVTTQLSHEVPARSNIRWEGDLTYVWCGQDGQGYLFAFVDCYDNEILGDYFGQRCRSEEAITALREAVQQRFPNGIPKEYKLVIRVDRGTQFIAKAFRQEAEKLGVTLEYCGIRCPDDKPYIESFFAMYKKEEVYRNDYEDCLQAKGGWLSFKSWYNEDRLNQGLNYLTPREACSMETYVVIDESEISPEVSLIGAGL
jgi:putative transposase